MNTLTLSEHEAAALAAIAKHDGAVEVQSLASTLGVDQSLVAAAVTQLAERSLVSVEERTHETLKLGDDVKSWLEDGWPERRIAEALASAGGTATIPDLSKSTGINVGKFLRFLSQKGWASKGPDGLTLADGMPPGEPGADEVMVAKLAELGEATPEQLADAGVDVPAARALLDKRPGALDARARKLRFVSLTDSGRDLAGDGGSIKVTREVNALTNRMLLDGTWRDATFRPYDVTARSETRRAGKAHPMARILEKTRRVFLELGFEQTEHGFVESGFWDFDALFQPQDHPARDMQDTFYLKEPAVCDLPDDEMVRTIADVHETGGGTGSRGWGYKWDPELARKSVLRTHTTASSIRAIHDDPKPPRRVFCIGPVFRRETIDYKHLPVFHQVDGIIVDENASFAVLLGLLETFYKKMGFDKIEFRPSFFPYTEPSLEVFVWMDKRSDWVEMGGAGMFRPEVTKPLGCDAPVLAWGLGLERLAMIHYGMRDIRDLYISKVSWLKETSLCL